MFIISCQASPSPQTETEIELPNNGALLEAPLTTTLPPAERIQTDEIIIATIPATKPERPSVECAGVDTMLYQLYESDDYSAFAQQHGLSLTEEGVGVEIQLVAVDAVLDVDVYQIQVRNQRANLVEAFLPIEQLCPLSQNEEVLRISPLRRLTPP